MPKPKFAIFLAAKDGMPWLPAQIKSIEEQNNINYKLFINNKNRFNIINTNENKQTIIGPLPDTGSTQTELTKYEMGQ